MQGIVDGGDRMGVPDLPVDVGAEGAEAGECIGQPYLSGGAIRMCWDDDVERCPRLGTLADLGEQRCPSERAVGEHEVAAHALSIAA